MEFGYKKLYMAVSVLGNGGKRLAYCLEFCENNNMVSVMKRAALHNSVVEFANMCRNKKQCNEIVQAWNESYKANGSYWFD